MLINKIILNKLIIKIIKSVKLMIKSMLKIIKINKKKIKLSNIVKNVIPVSILH
jgi:hypothetical protein